MKHRIEYIDVAKGITICLVVLGHVRNLPYPLNSIIYSFHMPLFFLLSGYFIKREDVLYAAKRMIPTLIVPYIFVGSIIISENIIVDIACGNPFDYVNLLSLFGVCWCFDEQIVSVGAIWFLIVLYLSKLWLLFSLRLRNRTSFLILGATLSILVSKVANLLIPFGFQQALVCVLYVYIGFMCKNYKLFDVKVPNNIMLLVIHVSILPFMGRLGVATRTNDYSLGIISVMISSFLSWLIVLTIKRVNDTNLKLWLQIKKFFIWCGKMSLLILAVHSIESRFLTFHESNFVLEYIVRLIAILSMTWVLAKTPLTRKIFHIK